jgi:hypothetical protein
MLATCIEQNDLKDYVLHEVLNIVDGINYRLIINAQCPAHALKIAYEVSLTNWEKYNEIKL